ncbi:MULTISPECIES: diaminobutyrate acetyltransferase [Chromohalobacter]|uniref:diaminobutyrate acetyltransferase n=1 Tax=Chromohalobacter TaxID=42054 RepID=UPI000D7096B5|nr:MULTISPECIES: diaminobutyrate acetyltransferase [Chromohalobacter]MBZ5877629.1 diaminobutyrate acetyltransferase [Chromohalobacter salexigens]MDO0946650.1 diaminobutyrate acetyltransferase [Chromohalobacter salexigens]NQY46803.1 diaminobutyrate acetyltransferase [Chromohalobacter sp.]NWO56630.1 diaminobutyrate acetyltransferase [Chromohalobacter salexigens]RXE48323.1 diaminobutyrate acetyltransferase [Chromohalobacter salexigens]
MTPTTENFTPSADLARPSVADTVIGSAKKTLFIRKPTTDDGWGIYELVKACPPLDVNSGYAYLLLATQFRDTCAVATDEEGEIVGFVSGYVKRNAPDTYFLWQVAVGEKARGTGLARRLVEAVLMRSGMGDVRHLETTITPDNEASWGLFKRLADRWQAPLNSREYFSTGQLGGEHDPENLVRIGPFEPQQI